MMLAALRIVARRLLIALAIVAIIVPSVVTLWAISADSHDLLDLAVTKTESIDPEVAAWMLATRRHVRSAWVTPPEFMDQVQCILPV